MFTIKAIRSAQSAPLEEYAIFEAGWVDVRANTSHGACAPGSKPYVEPDYSVSLFDKAPFITEGQLLAQINVGHGDHQFHTLYVLNEKGRTIQTLKALNHVPHQVNAGPASSN